MRENWRKASKKVYNLLVLFFEQNAFLVFVCGQVTIKSRFGLCWLVWFLLCRAKKQKTQKNSYKMPFYSAWGKESFSIFALCSWELRISFKEEFSFCKVKSWEFNSFILSWNSFSFSFSTWKQYCSISSL